ncbi:3-dehydroquinate synthase [Methanohalobium evestigatum Z-7303]|uniref:Glycerol-1-phosphate dehydrogenase [NAD(P)+] n=1 Tax=Methanohalobium evestigatum (strain ATCC BAA-1072 / DSM 3721 / NBRC 107634 / OCM 161 / Z-7303) TaxID=644295 RepID=D7E8D1_METEZ|nr:3-dehydroquinate synthase [Methanohalobium evestigatum Z-7303]
MIQDKHGETKWMQLPRDVVVGTGVINDITDVCNDLKLGDNALIVTGDSTRKIAGDIVHDELEDKGRSVEMYTSSSATMDEVRRVEDEAMKYGSNYLLGVGSGNSIDIAKLAATELDIPFLSVPTAASHDGIVSSRASIIHDSKTTSIQSNAPMAVVADTEIIANAPYRLLAAGCGDIVSNYTAVLDWELASRLKNESFSEYAASLSRMTAKILIDSADSIKPELESSARLVVKALVSSGVAMSIAGSSRPASGSEHMFSHALDSIAPGSALHGEQCGVGTIMMMYLHGGDWQMIRDGLKKIRAPTTAEELGVEDKYIIEALLISHTIRQERYTILGTSGLTRDAAEAVAKTTKVIS